jgi:hypothetical protein
MKKIIFTGNICLLFTFFAQAQKKQVNWNEIDPKFLEMKQYPSDTSAEALILKDNGIWRLHEGNNSFYYTLNAFKQVKILKKEAFNEFGTVGLVYRYSNQLENITDISASVTHSDGKTVKLDKAQIFEEKLDKDYAIKKFTFTGLLEGDIITYQFIKESKAIHFIGPWYFQGNVPVMHSEITFFPATRLDYQYVYTGFLTPKQEKDEYGSWIRFTMDSIPALKKDEVFITTLKDYCASISFQLSTYYEPNGIAHKFIDSWKNAAETLESEPSFGLQYKKKNRYSDSWKAVKPLLENVKTEQEKIDIIYDFVNEHVKWNEEFGFWCENDLNDAYVKGKGNSGQINLLMLALLREADIKAYPMLISTREHGKVWENYPLLQEFNHVLCLVEIGDKKIVLDGGSEFRPAGMIKSVSLVKRGWIIDGKNSRWEDIPATANNTIVTYSTFDLDEEGTLTGNITFSFQHYAAVEHRNNYKKDSNEGDFKKSLIEFFPDIQIDSIKNTNMKELKQALKKQVFCKIPNAAMTSGDMIYLKPFVISNFDDNPFKTKERNFPVDMLYLVKEQSVLNLNLPKGYEVEFTPKNLIVNLLDKAGKAQYFCEVNQNSTLRANFTTQFNETSFSSNNYGPLRDFYGSVAAKLEEQIVLKKKK